MMYVTYNKNHVHH